MQIEIDDQSMTMLTMLTKTQKRTQKAGASNRSLHVLEIHDEWILITFITYNSSLVPLLEGLCRSNPCRFGFSVLSFCRNRTNHLGINSPALWPTELVLHCLGWVHDHADDAEPKPKNAPERRVRQTKLTRAAARKFE